MTRHPFPTLQPVDITYLNQTLDALLAHIELHPTESVDLKPLDELHIIGFDNARFDWVRTTPRLEVTTRVRTVAERVTHFLKTGRWLEARTERKQLLLSAASDTPVIAELLRDADDVTQTLYYQLTSLKHAIRQEMLHGNDAFVFFETDAIVAKNEVDAWFRHSLKEDAQVVRMPLSTYVTTMALDDVHINA